MKNLVISVFLLFFIVLSCTNREGEIIDLINSVKKQNDDLKAQITSLKKTTDSAMVAIAKVTVSQAVTDKKLDAIQTELKSVLAQISSLSTQMTAANADLATIKAKLDALQVKCAELVAQIGALTTSLNSTLVDLKKQVATLKNTSDSALIVITKLSAAQASSDKNIVSIQAELKNVLSQIVDLSSQLGASNVDITSLKAKIDALQVKVNELVAQIASLTPGGNLKNGLVAYYPFNGNANDVSGNNLNGRQVNISLVNDRNNQVGRAIGLNGQSYVEVNHNNIFNSEIISISVWYNALNYTDNGQGAQRLLVSKRDASGWGGGFQMGLSLGFGYFGNPINGNGIHADWTNNSGNKSLGYYNFLQTNQWYHFVYIHSSNSVQLYLNGILVSELQKTGALTLKNNLPVHIGQRPAGLSRFMGKIDDVGIWNRALSADEVKYLYENDFRP